jgi:hypothetical protein
MTQPQTLRPRLKKVQAIAFKAVLHPLLPAELRAVIAETVLLLADLVERVERLEKERNGDGG